MLSPGASGSIRRGAASVRYSARLTAYGAHPFFWMAPHGRGVSGSTHVAGMGSPLDASSGLVEFVDFRHPEQHQRPIRATLMRLVGSEYTVRSHPADGAP